MISISNFINIFYTLFLMIIKYYFISWWLFLSFDKVWFTSLFGLLLKRIFTRENSNFLLDLRKPFSLNFLFHQNISCFCIWFTDKLPFLSIIFFNKNIFLIMWNLLLKFTNGNGRHLKKIAFHRTNLLFRFSVISFYFFRKLFL